MKAHSERVEEKNFRDFCGKPLFRWVLDTLLSIESIAKIVINTDAMAILEMKGLGSRDRVLVRDRKPELCGDFVSMNKVLADDVEAVPAEAYLMTHVTNPLISKRTIEGAIQRFSTATRDGTADSLFTVNKLQTRLYRDDASPINHDPQHLVRTQDLEPWFEENSNLYLFTRASFQRAQARIGEKPVLLEMNRLESIDIDDWDDWKLAEAVAASGVLKGDI